MNFIRWGEGGVAANGDGVEMGLKLTGTEKFLWGWAMSTTVLLFTSNPAKLTTTVKAAIMVSANILGNC